MLKRVIFELEELTGIRMFYKPLNMTNPNLTISCPILVALLFHVQNYHQNCDCILKFRLGTVLHAGKESVGVGEK